MPSLKDYRDRIASVKSTRKITSAMKMVAASKLKRAQEKAEASQPYAQAMGGMLARVAANVVLGPHSSPLLVGTGQDQVHLLVVVTSDRGLCGGFNTNVIRNARMMLQELTQAGKEVRLLCVGRKARDAFKREHEELVVKSYVELGDKSGVGFADANKVTEFVLDQFENGDFDVCTLVYNEFKSVLAQLPTRQQLIPFKLPEGEEESHEDAVSGPIAPYDFEPEEEKILSDLLPRNISMQIFRAMLDSAAGEQAARMTAMDNATRNAGDMINNLTLQYNRARQAYITKELIEIISGAEAV